MSACFSSHGNAAWTRAKDAGRELVSYYYFPTHHMAPRSSEHRERLNQSPGPGSGPGPDPDRQQTQRSLLCVTS